MGNMLSLIRNENMKIYKRWSAWIMLAILLVILLLFAGIVLKTSGGNDGNWKQDLKQQNAATQKQMQEKGFPEGAKPAMQTQIDLNNYHIKNDIPPLDDNTMWGYTNNATNVSLLVTVFVVIIASSIVSQEFSWGTIKLLLIRPIQRWKILLSKLITVILFAITCLIIMFILSLIIGGLFFGFDSPPAEYVYMSDGKIHTIGLLTFLFEVYGLKLLGITLTAGFAFMLSTLLRSNALAIGLSIFLQFAGSMVVGILAMFNDTIVKYIFFVYTDLTQYIQGHTLIQGTTLGFAIGVLAVYFVIFIAISFIAFQKRDVAA